MSTSLRTPRPRSIAAALAVVSLAGTGAAVSSAPALGATNSSAHSTIGSLPASPALGLLPHIDALGSHVIAVAPAGGRTEETSLTPSSGELWFSRLDDRPTKLDLAGVPTWAQPHLGTDAAGRAVAVYPRCASDAINSCDLYAWDVVANVERPIDEVNRSSVGELEGTMQHGAVAWTVAPAGETAGATAAPDAERTLRYRSTSGPSRTITTKGGRQLALRSGEIAQTVLNADQESSRVELVRVRDRSRRTLVQVSGGAGPRWPVGLRFFGAELRFAVASFESARLYRVPLSKPSTARSVPADGGLSSAAFARADQLVWIGESDGDRSAALLTARVPKRLR